MTRGLPQGLQEAQDTANFWRTKHAEEQKRRLNIEKSTEKAITEATQKAKNEGQAEGRLEASKEHDIWKDGFLAGRHSVETTNTAEVPKHMISAAAELMTPLEEPEVKKDVSEANDHAVETKDTVKLPMHTPRAAAEVMTPLEDQEAMNEGTLAGHHSGGTKNKAELPIDDPHAVAELMAPLEGQETSETGRDGVEKQEEDLAGTGDHETHRRSTSRQVGQQHRAHASGNIGLGGRHQAPDHHYTGHPSEALMSGALGIREGGEASRAIRGMGSSRAFMDPFHNARGGRQLGNQVNVRGDGRVSRSFDTEIRARNDDRYTRSFGTAWGNDRITRSSHRSPYHGYVSCRTLYYIFRH